MLVAQAQSVIVALAGHSDYCQGARPLLECCAGDSMGMAHEDLY